LAAALVATAVGGDDVNGFLECHGVQSTSALGNFAQQRFSQQEQGAAAASLEVEGDDYIKDEVKELAADAATGDDYIRSEVYDRRSADGGGDHEGDVYTKGEVYDQGSAEAEVQGHAGIVLGCEASVSDSKGDGDIEGDYYIKGEVKEFDADAATGNDYIKGEFYDRGSADAEDQGHAKIVLGSEAVISDPKDDGDKEQEELAILEQAATAESLEAGGDDYIKGEVKERASAASGDYIKGEVKECADWSKCDFGGDFGHEAAAEAALAAEASCMKVKSVGSCDAGGYVVGKLESELVPRFPLWGQHSHDVKLDDGGPESYYIGGDDGYEDVEVAHEIEKDDRAMVAVLEAAIVVAQKIICDAEVAGLAHHKKSLDESRCLLVSLQHALARHVV